MTLSFTQTINGKPNYFIEKIWASISPNGNLIGEYIEFLSEHEIKFGKPWDFYSRNQDPAELGRPPFNPKLHTIRRDKKNRWGTGCDIHFVINNRTHNRFQFAPVIKCVSVQEIEIKWFESKRLIDASEGHVYNLKPGVYSLIKVDGKQLSHIQMGWICKNDGFDSVEDFFAYFNKDFTGKIIHWTDLKY